MPQQLSVVAQIKARPGKEDDLRRVLATLQMEHYYARRLEAADACGRRSITMARADGDPDVLVSVYRAGPLPEIAVHERRVDLLVLRNAVARAIDEIGIGFLFAPRMHPAMKHAQPVRRELRLRTVFNLLGPLVNPARAQAQPNNEFGFWGSISSNSPDVYGSRGHVRFGAGSSRR